MQKFVVDKWHPLIACPTCSAELMGLLGMNVLLVYWVGRTSHSYHWFNKLNNLRHCCTTFCSLGISLNLSCFSPHSWTALSSTILVNFCRVWHLGSFHVTTLHCLLQSLFISVEFHDRDYFMWPQIRCEFFNVIWLSITFVAHMFPQVLQSSPKDYTMRISTEFMNLKGVHESQGSSWSFLSYIQLKMSSRLSYLPVWTHGHRTQI